MNDDQIEKIAADAAVCVGAFAQPGVAAYDAATLAVRETLALVEKQNFSAPWLRSSDNVRDALISVLEEAALKDNEFDVVAADGIADAILAGFSSKGEPSKPHELTTEKHHGLVEDEGDATDLNGVNRTQPYKMWDNEKFSQAVRAFGSPSS